MFNQEKILSIIRTNGPVIPAQIAKLIGTNILMASACLSELVDNKKLLISKTKVGGTPVYYTQGQEAKLQELYDNLNEKDKRAFNLLRDNKILKDDELEPLMRVAMRSIKDFAVPLNVTQGSNKLLFWKWYLLRNDEAESLIRLKLKPEYEVKKEKQETLNKEAEEKKAKEEKEKLEKQAELEKRKIEAERSKIEQEKRRIEEERAKIEKQRNELIKQREAEAKKAEEERLNLTKQRELESKRIEEERAKIEKQKQAVSEKKKQKISDPFLGQLANYFREKKIEVVNQSVIRKKSEMDFTVKIPSVVGGLDYYCKAKNKKKISDSDLSSAFVQGQLKKLPVLFLITGELTKKAKELLNTEFKKGLVVKKI